MKKSIIARIAVYSVLILVLGGLLIGGLLIGGFTMGGMPLFFSGDGDYTGEQTEAREGAVSAADVRDLEISWASGSVTIVPGDTDQIRFSETGSSQYTMVWHVSDETLSIEFSDKLFSVGFRPGKAKKDLTVTVPRNWAADEIEIDAASTDLRISDLTFNELNVDGASNDAEILGCTAGEISLDGASNKLYFEGSLRKLDSDGASNKITLAVTNQMEEIELDGVSSDLRLTAPADFGFTVDADGLSFDLETDFDVTRHSKNHAVAGDGKCLISIDGVSTSLEILKALLSQ